MTLYYWLVQNVWLFLLYHKLVHPRRHQYNQNSEERDVAYNHESSTP